MQSPPSAQATRAQEPAPWEWPSTEVSWSPPQASILASDRRPESRDKRRYRAENGVAVSAVASVPSHRSC